MADGLDCGNLISVDDLVAAAPAFTKGTIRHWLFHRKTNRLTTAVLKIGDALWIDIDHFNIWLSRDKDEPSEFQDLRTKEQLLESCRIKTSTLEYWLRDRHWNGLEDAVIKKGEKRIYIDIRKFNRWLLEQNSNPDFGSKIPTNS
jgi:hypothetical protein